MTLRFTSTSNIKFRYTSNVPRSVFVNEANCDFMTFVMWRPWHLTLGDFPLFRYTKVCLKKHSCNLHALERVWKRFSARCASQFWGKFVWICRSLNARYYTLTLKERCFFECTFQNLFATNKRCAIMKQKQGQRSLGHGRDNEGLRSRTWSFF